MGRTLGWFVGGISIALVASLWWGPRLLTWWATPPGQGMATMCADQVRWATSRLVHLQLITGVVLGVLLDVLASIVVSKRASRRQPPPQTPPDLTTRPRTA